MKLIQVKKDSAKFQLQRTNEIFFQQTDNLRSDVRLIHFRWQQSLSNFSNTWLPNYDTKCFRQI